MTYYHNLTSEAEQLLSDNVEIRCYNTNQNIPLVEYQDINSGIIIKQFIQMIIPNESTGNLHIYLALKRSDDCIIKESLWTLDQARVEAERLE